MCDLSEAVDLLDGMLYHVHNSCSTVMGATSGAFTNLTKGYAMAYDRDGREVKEKDIGQIVRYLTNTFNQATNKLERPFRNDKAGPNEAYIIQSEFAHLLNELMQAPKCMQQKYISDCNDFIDQVIMEVNTRDSAAA